jgi:fatty-acyl-CoA synthase
LIAPLITKTTPEEAFVAVEEAVKARGWTVVQSVPNQGRLEATDESFWFGFKDDVIIRVRTDAAGARVDVRSTSRVGLSDLGANSKRIRDLLDEIEVRLSK